MRDVVDEHGDMLRYLLRVYALIWGILLFVVGPFAVGLVMPGVLALPFLLWPIAAGVIMWAAVVHSEGTP